MKCLEFQRRRGDSRKFVIKAEILFTICQFAGISSPGFHMQDEMQELGTKHVKVKCAAYVPPFFWHCLSLFPSRTAYWFFPYYQRIHFERIKEAFLCPGSEYPDIKIMH